MASKRTLKIQGNFHVTSTKNYVVCLCLDRNEPNCENCYFLKGIQPVASAVGGGDVPRRVGTIVGYTLLGCAVLVVVACIVSAGMSASRRRASQKRQFSPEVINEDPYEDLDNLKSVGTAKDRKSSFSSQPFRDRMASFTGSVRYCAGGTGIPGGQRPGIGRPGIGQPGFGLPGIGLPGTAMDNVSVGWSRNSGASDTPPPLPDFRDLIGTRPSEPCPLADSHYNNRMSIMAHSLQKPRIGVVKTEASLQSLLESCQDTCQDNNPMPPTFGPRGFQPVKSDDYMDMRSATAAKMATKMADIEGGKH